MRPSTLSSVLLACAALGASGVRAAVPVAADASAGRQLVLETSPGGARVVAPDGAVALPGDMAAESFAATDAGWWAAGTVRREGRTALRLVAQERGAVRRVPAPNAPGLLQASPRLVVRDGSLLGIVWLAGDEPRGLTVWAAAWDGKRWGPKERIAAPRGGSQLAPSVAVLADGGWLAVWSSYDGGDDEILWSVRRNGAWSPAQRLSADNAVPDITPAVSAAGGGALVAWSRYDGSDYRLHVARFDGDAWSELGTFGGAGGVFPSWEGGAERSMLLFRSVAEESWTVVDLAPAGTVRATASLPGPSAVRPVVVGEAGSARFLLPDEESRPLEWR